MIERISGAIAVALFSTWMFTFLQTSAEAYDDKFGELHGHMAPLTATILLADPVGPLFLVNPLLLAIWYWFLTGRHKLPKYSIIWHVLVVAFSFIAMAITLEFLSHMVYLNGSRPVSASRLTTNILISSTLLFFTIQAYRTNRKGSDTTKQIESDG